MARWRLTAPHYIFTDPPQEWEYKETNRATGRPIVRKFVVPSLLDPQDPACFTEKDHFDEGVVVVCDKFDPAHPREHVCKGLPTLDMEPLDDEARKLSAEFIKNRPHPIESLPSTGGSYAEGLLAQLQAEVANVSSKVTAPATTQIEGMAEFMAAITAVMKQNSELIAALVNKPAPVEPAARRA